MNEISFSLSIVAIILSLLGIIYKKQQQEREIL